MTKEPRIAFPTIDEVAIGAFLHDIGKFSQRAFGDRAVMPDDVRNRAEVILPTGTHGQTHVHALWTDAFFSELVDEARVPAGIDRRWVRDCAVFHHKPLSNSDPAVPNGAVTQIVQLADWCASGAERKDRDAEAERQVGGRNAYRQTLLTSVFDGLALGDKPHSLGLRQPLRELQAGALSPHRLSVTDPKLPREYAALWPRFTAGYADLAARTRDDVQAFHDGLIALSERFTWAIPSSTMHEPDVGLHDHSRAVAAVAAALYAWHQAAGTLGAVSTSGDRGKPALVFISGDLSGIQATLFRLASEGARGLARLLRGRSLRFQLIAEAAARRVLEGFGLPPYGILQSAGGKFLILAGAVPDACERLDRLRLEIDGWMRDQYAGDLSFNLAMTKPFAPDDMIYPARLKIVRTCLGLAGEEAKQQPLTRAREALRKIEWDREKGVCSSCGVRPALKTGNDGQHRCTACHAETELGAAFPKASGIVIDRRGVPDPLDSIFDLNIALPGAAYQHRPARGWRMRGAEDHENLPAADRFSRPHVPRHDAESAAKAAQHPDPDEDPPSEGDLRTFADLADLSVEEGRGRPMLAALKADVDNLGQLFTRGFGDRRSLARQGALSRMMDAFFSGALAHRLATGFPNIYTVYAGGDDLLLLGPWRDVLRFGQTLRDDFAAFAGGNPDVTLSAGIALFDSKTPVTLAAREAEWRLDAAKTGGRNRVHLILGEGSPALTWDAYAVALRTADWLSDLIRDGKVQTATLYKLLWFDDRRRACEAGTTDAADWKAKLGYHLWRNVGDERLRRELLALFGISPTMAATGSAADCAPARIALSIALYRNR